MANFFNQPNSLDKFKPNNQQSTVDLSGNTATGGSSGSGRSKDPYAEQKKQCQARGGTWDAATNTCILPKEGPSYRDIDRNFAGGLLPGGEALTQKGQVEQGRQDAEAEYFREQSNQPVEPIETPQPEEEVDPNRKVDFNADGTVTITQGGETFNLTRDEYKNYLSSQKGGGYTETATTQRLAELQARYSPEGQAAFALQQAIADIGQIGAITPAQQARVNHSQAFAAGIARAIPGLFAGLATGAVAGAAVGGIGAIPGAIGGALLGTIGGITSGYIGNVQEQQRGEIGAAKAELAAATSNMRQFAMMASQDPQRAEEYISLYNAQLTRAHQARRQLKAETSGDLNGWMEDGRKDLADFDVFLQPGGKADLYGRRLQIALEQQVPLGIEDFTEEELKEMFGDGSN